MLKSFEGDFQHRHWTVHTFAHTHEKTKTHILSSRTFSSLFSLLRVCVCLSLKKGTTFIDRDGAMFKYVIEFLRTKTVQLDNMLPREVKQLRREFNYFGLKLVEDSPSTAYVAGGKRAPLTCE